MTDSTSQFLLPFLSTIHPAFIHILRAIFTETGGKDRGTIVAAKCFFESENTKNGQVALLVYISAEKIIRNSGGDNQHQLKKAPGEAQQRLPKYNPWLLLYF